MKRLFIYILCLLSFNSIVFNAKGQGLIIDRVNNSYNLKYDFDDAKPKNSIPNHFIIQIAKSIPQHYLITEYSAKLDLEMTLVKQNSENYQIKLKKNKFRYSGDYRYKGFNISKLIYPEDIEIEIVVEDVNSSKIFEFNGKSKLFTNDGDLFSAAIKDTSKSYSLKFQKVEIELTFNQSQKQNFDELIKLIDEYENSGFQIEKIKERLASIKTDQPALIPIYVLRIKEIKKMLENINPDNFYNDNTNLKQDPIDLNRQYRYLKSKTKNIESMLKAKMKRIDSVYCENAVDEYESGNINKAEELFNLSIQNNPYNSKSHLYLALIDLKKNQEDKALIRLKKVFFELKPGFRAKQQAVEITHQCFKAIQKTSEDLIRDEDFLLAINLLGSAKEICDSVEMVNCENTIEPVLSKAKYGLYNSYISIAEEALKNNRPDLANQYLNYASVYQKKNSEFVLNNSKVISLKEDIFDNYKFSLQQNIDNKNYSVALKLISSLQEFSDSNKLFKKSEEIHDLKSLVHQNIFNEMFNKALKVENTSGADAAEVFINDVLAYKESHAGLVEIDYNQEQSIKRIKSSAIIKNIEKINDYLKSGEESKARNLLFYLHKNTKYATSEARDSLNSIKSRISEPELDILLEKIRYNIFNENYFIADTLIERGLSESELKRPDYQKNFIQLQKENNALLCGLLQDSVLNLKAGFNLMIKRNEFNAALDIYSYYQKISEDYEKCTFDFKISDVNTNKLASAADFENLIKESELLFEKEEFYKYISCRKRADSIYFKNPYLKNSGHKFYDEVISYNLRNSDFVNSDLIYHYKSREYTKAFNHLKKYCLQNPDWTYNDTIKKLVDKIIEIDDNNYNYNRVEYAINRHSASPYLESKLEELLKYRWYVYKGKKINILIFKIKDLYLERDFIK